MPFDKLISFNPVTNALSDIRSDSITGSDLLIVRPQANPPNFILKVTTDGELIVVDKTGSLVWRNNTGLTGINEASINNNGEVLIRIGTTIRFFNSTGTQVWQQTITTLIHVLVGTSFVVTALLQANLIIDVQYRSLTDGSLLASYNPVDANNGLLNFGLAINATATKAVVCYLSGALDSRHRVAKFDRTAGREFDVIGTMSAGGTSDNAFAFCNSDASIVGGVMSKTNDNGMLRVYDGTGALLGTDTAYPNNATRGARINPNGNRLVVWALGQTGINHLKFYNTSPFSISDVAPTFTLPNNLFACDVSDENVFFVGDQTNQKIHVYEDSTTETTATAAQGVANQMVAVIRDV